MDVSKEKLDFCFQATGENILKECMVENTTCAIKSSLKNGFKEFCLTKPDVLLCAEYTGSYT
ncbi:hypothetical protein EZS27_043468, partial [termite gut metagenome]